jgi:hypothetical protein
VAAVASAFEISTHRPQVARPFPQRRRCRPGEPRLGAPPRRQKADDALGGHDHPPRDEYRMVGAERARAALQPHPRGRPRSLRYQEARPLPARRSSHHRRSALPSKTAGWELVHVAVDDASSSLRRCSARRKAPLTGFLVRTLRWFKRLGIRVERVMTDNGGSRVSRLFGKACRLLRLRHLRIRPHPSRNNGSTIVVVTGATKGPLRQCPG